MLAKVLYERQMQVNLDLTDDEKAALIELLRDTIERDRFPLSPARLRRASDASPRRTEATGEKSKHST